MLRRARFRQIRAGRQIVMTKTQLDLETHDLSAKLVDTNEEEQTHGDTRPELRNIFT